MTDAEQACAEAWASYLATADRQARNQLVLCYTNLVRYVASKVAIGLPDSVDREHLVSDGMLGLIDAISKFDPTRDVKFETYAIPRIRGSIIDELRKQDRVPRSVRSKARTLTQVTIALEGELGRTPSDTEMAEKLDISMAELWVMQSEASVALTVPLEDHANADPDRHSVADTLFDVRSNPEEIFEVGSEMYELIATAIAGMSERSRTILALYYLEDKTLAEIGEILGVTESRVCQLVGRLLESLRDTLVNGNAGFAA